MLVVALDRLRAVNDAWGREAGDAVLAATAAAIADERGADERGADERGADEPGADEPRGNTPRGGEPRTDGPDRRSGRRAVVRRGGAGFVVLLSGPPRDRPVGVVAESVRRRVARLRVAVDTGRGPVTISDATVCVGAAAEHPGRVGPAVLLWSADSALHSARRSARDAVRVAGGGWSDPAPRSAWRGPLG